MSRCWSSRRLMCVVSLVVLAVMQVGCGLEGEYLAKRQFAIDPDAGPASDVTQEPTGEALRIRPFRVAGQYAGSSLVYRRGDFEFDRDFYNLFVVPPDDMITNACAEWLLHTGLFTAITGGPTEIRARYILEGFVPSLYADLRDPDNPLVVLEIQFFLLDNEAGGPTLILQHTALVETEIEGTQPEQIVAGWNASMAEAMTQFVNRLDELDEPEG